jgi:hypothetical protein
MSLFKWFAKKPDAPSTVPPDSSGLGQVDVTLPLTHTARIAAQGKSVVEAPASSRKHERMEQRELLYSVVRDCMNGVGVLSSSYKFKVLSLDSHGRHYLIMMDLPREQVGDTARLSEVESLIAKHAKAQHDILVTAVYWRVNEQVTAGLRPASRQAPATAQGAPGVRSVQAATTPAATASPRAHAPLLADELAAFKAAVGSASSQGKAVRLGELTQSGPRNPSPPQFADTQIDDVAQPLSGSQYGDLT